MFKLFKGSRKSCHRILIIWRIKMPSQLLDTTSFISLFVFNEEKRIQNNIDSLFLIKQSMGE